MQYIFIFNINVPAFSQSMFSEVSGRMGGSNSMKMVDILGDQRKCISGLGNIYIEL